MLSMIAFYLMFALSGLGVIALGMYLILYSGDTLSGMFIILLGMPFLGASIYLIFNTIKQSIFTSQAVKLGKPLTGTIVDYVTDNARVNGRPFMRVVVKFQHSLTAEDIVLSFPTGTTDPSKWPIGSMTYIYEYNGQYAWPK